MHENISSCVQVVWDVRKYKRAFHLLQNASETAQIYHEILLTFTHAQKYINWIWASLQLTQPVYMHENISSCVQVVWEVRKYQRAFHLLENASETAQIYHEIPQLPHMRRIISPEFRLVYNPLNMSICMRTFPHAYSSCKRSVSTKELFICLKMRPKLRRSNMKFSQLPHMRRSISPEFRLVYNSLNMSICMRTFPHACWSCERSVSTKERFTCLKIRPKLRRSTMKFSQLPHMRRSISPEFRLVYNSLNMSICMRTFPLACR